MVKKTNLIIIFGGGMKKNKDGTWQTRNYNQENRHGSSGDRLRVLAGYYLYNDSTNSLIVASGGKGTYKNISDAPPVSSVLKKELVELGIPKNKIIEENKSDSTYQELLWLKKFLTKEKYGEVKIISNKYHLPRIKIMANLPSINLAGKIKIISAEEILIKYDPKKWQKIIKLAYAHPKMKKRIALEKIGIKTLKSGNYKFR